MRWCELECVKFLVEFVRMNAKLDGGEIGMILVVLNAFVDSGDRSVPQVHRLC